MTTIAFYDTKSYDREYFSRAVEGGDLHLVFHEHRLNADTAATSGDALAVCSFVNDRVDRACLAKLAKNGVRIVALRSAGYNHVDLQAARELGLRVVRVPAYSPYAVAEHAVALVQTLNRKIHRAYNRVREQNFTLSGLVGFDLHGKTVGIVGTGKIGKIAAKIFTGFGMRVLAHDAYPDEAWAKATGAGYVPLDRLLADSDIVSLHIPLTPGTRHLLDDRSFALMKPGALLVNTSRGALVDSGALITALKSGRLGGAALDVYEEEEGVFFEDHSGEIPTDEKLARLMTFPNVLITSHQGFLTCEGLAEIARATVENILKLESGGPFLDGTAL